MDMVSLLLSEQTQETDSIPFIFVTTKADQRDFCTAMYLGADDYLTKPVAKPDLLGAICSCLERAVQQV